MNKTSVLIVEDEAIIAADLAAKLQRLGYGVAGIAAGGEEAVRLAGQLRPQLVLMDIRLEGAMDGIAAAEAIRREHDLPVIYLTAHSDPATLARAKVSGPFGYILKPFEERELATHIELGLYKHQADCQLQLQADELQARAAELAAINKELRVREELLLLRTQELDEARREAENERNRLEAVMQALPVGMAIVDARGGSVRCNKAYDQVWRGPRPTPSSVGEYAEYKAWWVDTGKAVAPEQWASAIAVLKGETVVGQLMKIRRFDGSFGFVINSAAPIRDAAGNIVGSAVAIQDITDLHQAEEALRESEERFRLFMDHNPAIAWMKDEQGRHVYLNRTCEERFGMRPADWCGKTDFELWPPEIAAEFRKNDLAVLAAGESTEVIEETVNPDGSRSFWLNSKFPFRNAAGKSYVAGIGLDITGRKQAEEAIQQRTAEVEASNRELEAYAYSISHDLRTPLRAIHSYSDILLADYADVLDAAGKDHLQRVCAAAERMSTLMEAMLNLSRLVRSEPRLEEVNLTRLAQEAAGELRRAEPERRVEFVIAENMTARADAAMIRAVLDHLLRNAWKFTAKHDRARIEFDTAGSGSETIYYVRDDGAGFNMEYAEKLFKAFQLLHRPGEYPGTGIGLATVQRIIHRHGGRIWAEGEVEKGATFYFTLEQRKTMMNDA